MGIENYIAIAICYAIGCGLSYKAGLSKGIKYSLILTIETVAEMSEGKISAQTLADGILAYRRKHPVKRIQAK